MEHERGLTLVELVITVVIIGIVLAVGVPNFTSLVRSNAATSSANEFVAALNTARSEATLRNGGVTLCASDNPQSANPGCSGDSGGWANGWVAWADEDDDGTLDDDDEVIRVWEGLSNDLGLTESNGNAQVAFGSRGGASADMDFTLEPTGTCSAEASRTINVSLVGRVEVKRGTC